MRPSEEEAGVYNTELTKVKGYHLPAVIDDTLARRFPELARAGGGVDPAEAIVALLDRIAELEVKVRGRR